MADMTRVEINPNLRIDGHYTVVSLDDDVYGDPPKVLDTVLVFERSSGLQGKAWVTEIDEVDRSVTLLVDWANLDIPATFGASTQRMAANLWLPLGKQRPVVPEPATGSMPRAVRGSGG